MSLHRRRVVLFLGLLFAASCLAPSARAQEFATIAVTGAAEETRGFATRYSQPNTGSGWNLVGSAIRIYRPTRPAGPITIDVELPPSQIRSETGLTGDQHLRLFDSESNTTIVSDTGPANEVLTIDHELVAPVVTGNFLSLGVGPIPSDCGAISCIEIVTNLLFLSYDVPRFDFGDHRVRPFLFKGPGLPTHFLMFPRGINPFTNLNVSVDGIAMTRVPSGLTPLGESPGLGVWDRWPQDPLLPGQLFVPGPGPVSLYRWAINPGVTGVRVGLPADFGTGLHHVRVTGSAYPSTTYNFAGNTFLNLTGPSSGHATLDVDEEFIFVEPKLQVSPLQASPGSTITVTGTGFAPSNLIQVLVSGVGAPPLGAAATDLTGRFTLVAQLPSVTSPPFVGLWPAAAPPGATANGLVRAQIGDAEFRQHYGIAEHYYDASITFLKPGDAPSTTTTTQPGQPGGTCTFDSDCDDGDPCTNDVCAGGACTHTPLSGAAGVRCAVPPTGLDPSSCENEDVPDKATRSFDKATNFLDRAIGRTGKAVKRLIKRADKMLKRTKRIAQAAQLTGDLSPTCVAGIADVVDGVRSRAIVILPTL